MVAPLQQLYYLRLLEEEDREAVALVMARNRLEQRKRHRRFWVKPWLQRRPTLGQYETLFQELDRESEGDYMSFIRMDRNFFAEVLQRVEQRKVKGGCRSVNIHSSECVLVCGMCLLGPRIEMQVPYSNHLVRLSVRPSVFLSVSLSARYLEKEWWDFDETCL
jgi:hypothetical protein